MKASDDWLSPPKKTTSAELKPQYVPCRKGGNPIQLRGREKVTRLAHNQEIAGALPAYATKQWFI